MSPRGFALRFTIALAFALGVFLLSMAIPVMLRAGDLAAASQPIAITRSSEPVVVSTTAPSTYAEVVEATTLP